MAAELSSPTSLATMHQKMIAAENPPLGDSSMPPTPLPSPADKNPSWRKLADNPYAVIALIFCVTGCLGIPLILVSRTFTPAQKALWVVVSLIYTAILFGLVITVWVWTYYRVMYAVSGA